MATAMKAIYEIQAQYTGKNDFKQLNSDLKTMGKVESFSQLQQSFGKLNQEFVDAKARMRELRSEMSQPGNGAMRGEYERANESVNKVLAEIIKQKERLSTARNDLKSAGVDVVNLAGEYDRLKKSVNGLAWIETYLASAISTPCKSRPQRGGVD